MDFRQYARDQLPSLLTPCEPEILEELAQHLEDLYRESSAAPDSIMTKRSHARRAR